MKLLVTSYIINMDEALTFPISRTYYTLLGYYMMMNCALGNGAIKTC